MDHAILTGKMGWRLLLSGRTAEKDDRENREFLPFGTRSLVRRPGKSPSLPRRMGGKTFHMRPS